jgi:hypothetical protein
MTNYVDKIRPRRLGLRIFVLVCGAIMIEERPSKVSSQSQDLSGRSVKPKEKACDRRLTMVEGTQVENRLIHR